jgi:hypothetical protein
MIKDIITYFQADREPFQFDGHAENQRHGVVQVGPTVAAVPPTNGSFYPFTVVTVATGLTVGPPYWFDLEAWVGSGGGGFEILNGMAVIEEIFG